MATDVIRDQFKTHLIDRALEVINTTELGELETWVYDDLLSLINQGLEIDQAERSYLYQSFVEEVVDEFVEETTDFLIDEVGKKIFAHLRTSSSTND